MPRGAQIVVHSAILAVKIGFKHDLVIPLHVVSAGGDFVQPHRLGRQGIPPVKAGERGGGIVGDAGEIISELLAGHDLHEAGFLNGDVGIQGLVGHGRLDNLAGMLNLHINGSFV